MPPLSGCDGYDAHTHTHTHTQIHVSNCLLIPTPAEKEWKKKEQRNEDEGEDGEMGDELWALRTLQKQELNKVGTTSEDGIIF